VNTDFNLSQKLDAVQVRLTTTSAEPGDLPRAGWVLVNYPVKPASDGTFRKNIAAHSLLTRRTPDLAGPCAVVLLLLTR